MIVFLLNYLSHENMKGCDFMAKATTPSFVLMKKRINRRKFIDFK